MQACRKCLPSVGSDKMPWQVVVFGPQGAGKTLFFLRLIFGDNKWKDLPKDLEGMAENKGESSGYVYDVVNTKMIGPVGFWDVPGNAVVRNIWPMFYRYITVTCVIFMVDSTMPLKKGDTSQAELANDKKKLLIGLEKQKGSIHFLLNEDELVNAAFILILNTREEPKKRGVVETPEEVARKQHEAEEWDACVKDALGVQKLKECVRFLCISLDANAMTVDCENFAGNSDDSILGHLKKVLVESGHEV